MKALRLSSIVALLTVATMALAGPLFRNTLLNAYKVPAGSPLEKALKSPSGSCVVCHSTIPELNKFGAEIKAALKACNSGKDVPYDKVTAAMFKDALKKVETRDSDGDGVSNLDEFLAGTLPGDAKSKPAVVPKPPDAPKPSDTPKPADPPAKPADTPSK